MAATACGMRTPLMRFVLSRQFKSFRFPRTSLFCVGSPLRRLPRSGAFFASCSDRREGYGIDRLEDSLVEQEIDKNIEEGAGNEHLGILGVELRQDKTLDSGLYVVGTPIGNLEDVTLRALRVLKQADGIFAEDTRHTAKLLNYYNIKTPLISCHTHNEGSRVQNMLGRLTAGEKLVVVSDAGMPLVSDPGGILVAAAVKAGLNVVPVPGPCAAIAALVGACLPSEAFTFIGFLPSKASNRKKRLQNLQSHKATQVMYVGPHDLLTILKDMDAIFGGTRRCCVARELTKVHEEFWRGSIGEAVKEFSLRKPRGEITLLVEGNTDIVSEEDVTEEMTLELQRMFDEGVSVSSAAKEVAKQMGKRKNEVYRLAMEMQGNTE